MNKKKQNLDSSQPPNFILYDMGVQNAFAQMCQKFTEQTHPTPNAPSDWLIIDNDTGKIITPKQKDKT